jgi:phage shock protein PspC (stress-responsive transcriptional regulator)
MAAGVCGGLAEYSGIDVVLWRVAFVALALLGGSGVLLYLVLWVLMPAASPIPRTPLDRGVERFRTALTETAAKAMGPRTPRS